MRRSVFFLLPSLVVACSGAPAPRTPRALDLRTEAPRDDPRPYVLAELAPGATIPRSDPAACTDSRCGEAGALSRVVLPRPQTAVLALLDRYVRALNARSADALRPLFEDTVGAAHGAAPRGSSVHAREQVIAAHAELIAQMDPRGFGVQSLRVVSYEGCRATRCGALLHPGDWYVEWRPTSFRVTPMMTMAPPTRLVVRFTDGVPRIAALSDEFFLRRRP